MQNNMNERPEYIKNFVKPKNTEIKFIKGHWYLYEKIPQYDKIKKKTKWKSGGIIGKVTPEGLIPSKHRTPKEPSSGKPGAGAIPGGTGEPKTAVSQAADVPFKVPMMGAAAPEGNEVQMDGSGILTLADITCADEVETASVGFLFRITARMREGLQLAFPSCWKTIYAIAMLRAINGRGGRFCRIEGQYKRSYLAHIYPNLQLDKESLTAFLEALGMRRLAMVQYMQFMHDDDEKIAILDGHRIICSSVNIRTARLGYDTKGRHKRQINVIYLLSKSELSIGVPEYYKQYSGSTNDMKALEDICQESGFPLTDITVVGDKGCTSSKGTELLENGESHFVLAVKRGDYGLDEKTPEFNGYDGVFNFHSRGIKHYTIESDDHKTKIVVYLDLYLLAHEGSSRIMRSELSSNKTVRRVERELNRRKADLDQAQRALKQSDRAVDKAKSRIAQAEGKLAVDECKRKTAEATVNQKKLSLSAKQDKLNAAKSESQKSKAEGVVKRAEAALETAEANLKTAKTVCDQDILLVLDEKAGLEKAQEKVAANTARLQQCKTSVEAGEKLLELAKSNAEDVAALLAENPDASLDVSLLDPVTKETGTFALKTDRMDLSAEDIYRLYKQRPAIEEYFKIYDDTLGFDSSYMQNVSSEEAWLFFNHLSATMAVLALNEIADSGQSKNVSFNGLMELLSSVRAARSDDGWTERPVEEKTQDICMRMGYDPSSLPCG